MSAPQAILSSYYNPVLQFNEHHADRVAQLCAPLKDCFNIETFAYFRGLDDGKYLLLSNDSILTEVLAKYDFFVRTPHFKKEVKKYHRLQTFKGLWPDPSKDAALQMIKDRGGRFKGFYMVRQIDGAFEVLMFAHDEKYTELEDFFVNHHASLEKFVDTIKRTASDLFDTSDETRLGTSPNIRELCPVIDDMFMDEAPWQEETEHFDQQIGAMIRTELDRRAQANNITPRELEILTYLTKGKTAKEIAYLLDSSPRTIEVHIYNIRTKTGCNSRFALTQWFEERFKGLEV